jgi:hypothetical protein
MSWLSGGGGGGGGSSSRSHTTAAIQKLIAQNLSFPSVRISEMNAGDLDPTNTEKAVVIEYVALFLPSFLLK